MNYTWAKKNDIEHDIGIPNENAKQSANYAIFDHMKNCVGFVRSEKEARLIAAAPEMLEACRKALDNLQRRSETRQKWTTQDQKVFEILKDAIAKAEGEE